MAECIRCKKSNVDRHNGLTKLIIMPTKERPFEAIVKNFIGELVESEAFNIILVVIEWFAKVPPYISTNITLIADSIATCYINNIWRLYGLQKIGRAHV